MNNKAFPLIALLAAGLLAGCAPDAAPELAPLAGARIGGPFALTDGGGRTVTDAQFAGRYRLIYFGYTFCPDICPTSLQTLMKGYRLLAERAPAEAVKLQPIFITVDPERDTPAVIRDYVAAFGPELIGLTGSSDQIAAVAKRHAVFYAKRETPGASGYLMDHMSQAMLFGPAGEPIALIPQDGTPAQVADELQRWIG